MHFLHNLIARKFPKFLYFQFLSLFFLFANVVLINVFDLLRTSQTRQVVDYETFYVLQFFSSSSSLLFNSFCHPFNREILLVLNELLS